MKCFLACFTASKHNKRIPMVNAPSNRDVAAETPPIESVTVEIPITEPKEKKLEEEKLSCDEEIKVTSFNSNDKINEGLSPDEAVTDIVGRNEVEKVENEQEQSNPKYQACSKQEFDDDSRILVEEESSESLFSLSIDSRKHKCGDEVGEKEVSSPMPKCPNGNSRERNQTQSVENLPQFKTVKATLHHEDKENINSQQNTPTDASNHDEKKPFGKEIAVETSLSSWLNEPETTPLSKGSANSVGNSVNGGASSPRSCQSRRILGVLTVKQCPGSTTPTGRNSQSSDDTSILGTVGSYWRRTGWTVDSDSSSSSKGMLENLKKHTENGRKKLNSVPFEARLDREV
ncbi:uncharacterized protein [Euphorbia lathyris]|uniref:uncharacterized protein n=1 Tax=Euphorbia lathyris TaxID=212925 RepID=UPI00331350C6